MKLRVLGIKSVIVFIVFVLIFSCCKKKDYLYSKNLIANGEFEGDSISPWICNGQVDLITENKANGVKSVKLTCVVSEKTEIRQDIDGVFGDFEMILRGKVCTHGVAVARACVSVHDDNASMHNAPYGYVGRTDVGLYETNGSWEDFKLTVVIEGEATELSITLWTELGNEGDYVLYDDVSLEVRPIR